MWVMSIGASQAGHRHTKICWRSLTEWSWFLVIVLVLSACSEEASPESDLPRWPPTGLSPDVFFHRMESCIEDHGFAVEIDYATYEISFDLGNDSQREAAKEAIQVCEDEIDPTFFDNPPPLTDKQMKDLYPYIVARAECLTEFGYPMVDVPSLDRFTDLSGRFDPASALVAMGVQLDFDHVVQCRTENKPA